MGYHLNGPLFLQTLRVKFSMEQDPGDASFTHLHSWSSTELFILHLYIICPPPSSHLQKLDQTYIHSGVPQEAVWSVSHPRTDCTPEMEQTLVIIFFLLKRIKSRNVRILDSEGAIPYSNNITIALVTSSLWEWSIWDMFTSRSFNFE